MVIENQTEIALAWIFFVLLSGYWLKMRTERRHEEENTLWCWVILIQFYTPLFMSYIPPPPPPRIHFNTCRSPQQTKSWIVSATLEHQTEVYSSGQSSNAHTLASFGRGQAHMKCWKETAGRGPCLFFDETCPGESTVSWWIYCDWRCYYKSPCYWCHPDSQKSLPPDTISPFPLPQKNLLWYCFAVLPGTKS